MNGKYKSLEDLSQLTALLRKQGKKIVHCHGVFDLLHLGHIRHFEQAKKHGDVLIVTVTPDRYVNKGPDRPVFTEELRMEALASLSVVDYVALNRWPMATETIKLLQPDYYVKGPDYMEGEKDLTGGILKEKEAVESVHGHLIITDDITFSSSHLINQYMAGFPKGVSDYLTQFRRRYSTGEIIHYLEKLKSLRVLVIGETIIDEYQYCETLGKTGKEPILAARYLSHERFAGGILAVANHVAGFCKQVAMLTYLGERNSQEEFVRQSLRSNIQPIFLHKPNSPTIVKRRFVEVYPLQKLFEIYEMNGSENDLEFSRSLSEKLRFIVPDYDVVMVTDYGHGMLDRNAVDILCSQAKFLAINTQVNAANQGFHTISKYHRADYICISEKEIRLEARSQQRNLQEIIREVSTRLNCDRIMVTRGQNGSLCFGKDEGFHQIPAFTNRVVDRIGAGDSVLSITAPCVALRAPMEVVGFIGNAVGAQAVRVVGNRKPIDRIALLKHIESLMK